MFPEFQVAMQIYPPAIEPITLPFTASKPRTMKLRRLMLFRLSRGRRLVGLLDPLFRRQFCFRKGRAGGV